VGLVALVRGAELSVDAGAEFCLGISVCCAYAWDAGASGLEDGETRLRSRGSYRWRKVMRGLAIRYSSFEASKPNCSAARLI
jgi:hypothetical protein